MLGFTDSTTTGMVYLFYLLTVVDLMFTSVVNGDCYTKERKPYSFFGSVTSYQFAQGSKLDILDDCTPIYIWALMRHGTRYMPAAEITRTAELFEVRDQIVRNHQENRGKLCPEDVENFRTWNFTLDRSLDEHLTEYGKQELALLARRLKKQLNKLLESNSSESYVFQSTNTERTIDSAIAFSNELLHTNYGNVEGNHITENIELLHLGDNCETWLKEVKNNPANEEELTLLEKSKLTLELLEDVSERLGFNETLDYDTVLLMSQTCVYEYSWDTDSRPAFCAAFSDENFKLIEYIFDLKQHVKYGYGSPMTAKLGCPVVRELMLRLVEADTPPPSHKIKGHFYFAHSKTMKSVLVKLGLFRDEEPLRHDNYEELKEKRKWRSSCMDPFAANIIAILYECPNNEDKKVVFYHNEKMIKLPSCNNSDSCSLAELKQIFEDVFDATECNGDFCKAKINNGAATLTHSTPPHIGIGLLITLTFVAASYFFRVVELF